MMPKITPGPWRLAGVRRTDIHAAAGVVATAINPHDARVLVLAPDLLDSLRNLLRLMVEPGSFTKETAIATVRSAQDIIIKIEGRS